MLGCVCFVPVLEMAGLLYLTYLKLAQLSICAVKVSLILSLILAYLFA